MEETVTLVGTHSYTIYDNNGFSIQTIKLVEEGGRITAKGYNLPQDQYTYQYKGTIIEDKKYGRQLNVQLCTLYINEKEDIIKYLKENIAGIGKKYAEALYKAYGKDVFKQAKDYDAVFAVIRSEKKAKKITESAQSQLVSPEMFEIISKYQIQPKILNKLGFSFEAIKENPFIMSGNVTFYKLNRMAIDFGSDLICYDRIRAAVNYVLNELIGSRGHMYYPYDEFVTVTLNLLNKGVQTKCSLDDLKKTLRKMNNDQEIVLRKANNKLIIYSKFNYETENIISESIIKTLLRPKDKISVSKIKAAINETEKEFGISLAEKQEIAVKMVMENNFSIITGSAGTGKTTVLKTAIRTYEKIFKCEDEDILLLAPTGRAAQRMSEATMHNAQTVHSKLLIDEDGSVGQEIEEKIIFIDEMSMTDAKLLSLIFKNTKNDNAKFVFLGDPNQLPSVGAGNILEDCILSEVIPTTKLDVIHRQAEDSLIIKNALNILKGNSSLTLGNDFDFVKSNTIKDDCVEIFKNEFAKYKNNIMAVQIITPMKTRGDYCQETLNNAIQKLVNPIEDGDITFTINNYKFHIGDKVICQKNNKLSKNGDIGLIKDIYRDEDNKLSVDIDFYNHIISYTVSELRDLKFALAYAITIHKSQGSEFPSVIMPVGSEQMCMLQRNLMYTAVTRASKKMTLVGSKAVYKRAVEKNVKQVRLTALKQYLVKAYKEAI